jgi:hypothetical protein
MPPFRRGLIAGVGFDSPASGKETHAAINRRAPDVQNSTLSQRLDCSKNRDPFERGVIVPFASLEVESL